MYLMRYDIHIQCVKYLVTIIIEKDFLSLYSCVIKVINIKVNIINIKVKCGHKYTAIVIHKF